MLLPERMRGLKALLMHDQYPDQAFVMQKPSHVAGEKPLRTNASCESWDCTSKYQREDEEA